MRFQIKQILCFFCASQFLFGQGFTTKNVVSDTLILAKKFNVIDLDNDGDMDIVAAANDTSSAPRANIVWFENNGSEVFTQRYISNTILGGRSVWVADYNGDGDLDVAAGGDGRQALTWYESDGTPSDGGWISHVIGTADSVIYTIFSSDIDQDNDQEIIASYYNIQNNNGGDIIRWFDNNGTGIFTSNTLVSSYEAAAAVWATTINNDNEIDIITVAAGEAAIGNAGKDLSWWSNDGSENFTQNSITPIGDGPWVVSSADVDNDGDNDILLATWGDDKVSWWANNGSGSFGSENVITTSYVNARSLFAADIDGDADMDMVSVADNDNSVDWYNNDGTENFTKTNISITFSAAYFCVPEDMDGDGDVDVIATAQDANELSWWKNDLAEEQIIASGDPAAVPYNTGKVVIDFAATFSGGNTSVFFNHGAVSDKNAVATGIDHVAANGFYTITTAATTYVAQIKFAYAGISEWSAISNKNTLRICYFDPTLGASGQWVEAGSSQTVDTANDTITVSGLTSELAKYSIYTLGSTNTDNALPVELVAFEGTVFDGGIDLNWKTESEVENIGFELWRKSSADTIFKLISSYEENDLLKGLGTSSFGQDYTFTDYDVETGRRYSYQLVDVAFDGKRFINPAIKIDYVTDGLVRVVNGLIPERLDLQQNYPNPFNPSTRIHFSVPREQSGQNINLVVFNQLGQRVKTLFNSAVAEGNYSLVWNGTNDQNQAVASGMYIYLLHVGNNSIIKRMILIR
jgi:FG-GAP-like repeat/FlgD Ig-like domain